MYAGMEMYIQRVPANHPTKLVFHGSIKPDPKRKRLHGNFLIIIQTGVFKMSKQKANHLIRLANEMKKAGALSAYEYNILINKLRKAGGTK